MDCSTNIVYCWEFRWNLEEKIQNYLALNTVYTSSPYIQQFLYIFLLKLQFIQVALNIQQFLYIFLLKRQFTQVALNIQQFVYIFLLKRQFTQVALNIQQFLYIFLLKLQFIQVALTFSNYYTFSCSNYSLYR